MSQVAEEFEESEFEIQTSELGERRTADGREEGDMWSLAALFSPSVVCARAREFEGDGVILIEGAFF